MRRFWFFDLDGTLADTDPDIREAWKAALRDLGLECPTFDTQFVAGPPIEDMVKILFPAIFTDALARDIRAGFARHYDNDGFPNTYEYPGVMDQVKALKARGATIAIVTNKRHVGALAMAKKFGWGEVFDGIYSGDMFADSDGSDGRPAGKLRKPELLRWVLGHYGARPEDAVLVGDTVNDFEAARKNGVLSVGVTWGYGKASEFAEADVTVSSPDRIAEL